MPLPRLAAAFARAGTHTSVALARIGVVASAVTLELAVALQQDLDAETGKAYQHYDQREKEYRQYFHDVTVK